ncbi:uncharacterized protein LOC124293912 [Neodiprion lecontei]|uniref:Uncharacterized protein LOC124293912 n=1 Tax=Neodiprion lecontei TaxID=441921 RepID=A0ABM3FXR7_NEOLC|nr:uncharacterized protein LOC124293912 [Neodiprion lecontei]
MIIAFLEQEHREWDLHLPDFRFAYNTAYHTSAQTSPAFLNFGRTPVPINSLRRTASGGVQVERQSPELWKERMERLQLLREWVAENLANAFEQQAGYYNRRHRTQPYSVGELVLKRQHTLSSAAQNYCAKLAKKFHGPYRITRTISPVVVELSDVVSNKVIGKTHIGHLKAYRNN